MKEKQRLSITMTRELTWDPSPEGIIMAGYNPMLVVNLG